MGTPAFGRGVVAALVAGCAVLAVLIALRDCGGPGARTIEPSRETRARPAASSTDVVPIRRPLRRASQVAQTEPGPLGVGGFAVVRVTASEDGTPLRGASVVVPGIDDERARRVTDADGVARFGPFVAHEWPFLASADGRLARTVAAIVPEGGEATIEIALEPAAALAIRVEDAAGEGVELASVDAEPLGGGIRVSERTDARGRALVAMPQETLVRVSARADGFSESAVVVRTPPRGAAAAQVTIRFAPSGQLVGVVRNADGTPAPNAFVFVRPSHQLIYPESDPIDSVRLDASALHSKTDEEGRYAVTGLVAGRRYHAFAAITDGFPRSASPVAEDLIVTAEAPDIARDFNVARAGTLVVRVTNADGTPAAEASISLEGQHAWVSVPLESSGCASFYVLSRSETTVFATTPDGRSAARRVTVPGGQTMEVSLQLAPSPVVTGVVVDDAGRAIGGAWIRLRSDTTSSADSTRIDWTQSAEDGTWRISALLPGPCTLEARCPGHAQVERTRTTAPSESTRLVLRRRAAAKFRLRQPAGESTVTRPYVRLTSGACYTEYDAADGTHRFEYGPADGDRVAIVFSPSWARRSSTKPTERDLETIYAEYAPIVRTLHPVPGQVEDLGDLYLERPSMLRARVVDGAGRAIAGALAHLDADFGMQEPGPPVITDSAGAFAFRCAPAAGLVPLVVKAAGFLDRHVEVSSGGSEPPTITLSRGGLLWGEVVDAAGAAVADAEIRLTDARDVARTVRADAHGIFGVRVEAGRWMLAADGGSAESAQAAEGGDTRVRLVAGGR